MRVFDVHAHVFPDRIAAPTVAAMGEEACIEPVYDGTVAGLRKHMRDSGVSAALNCPVATKPEQVASITRWASQLCGDGLYSFGSVHPDHPDPRRALEDIRAAGMRGIKLHPEYQTFRLGEARLNEIWEACCDLELIVLMHCGADVAYAPPFRSDPRSIAALLDAYPGLCLIAGHFGSWRMWDDVARFLVGRNVYLDTSFTVGLLPDADFVRLIRLHGVERVLFGTDTPWRDQGKDVAGMMALPLTDAEKKRIFWENAAELLGVSEEDY